MRAANHILIVFSCMFSLAVFSAQAITHIFGWGRVNMQGAIIDSACDISVNSRDQIIDMGVVPMTDIIRNGHGSSKPFSIDLVNCMAKNAGKANFKQFQVTFDGDAEGELFGVQGEVSGVALQIIDQSGNIALPGKPLPLADIIPGDRQLDYTLKLVTNNRPLKAGNYFSSVRFKMDYF